MGILGFGTKTAVDEKVDDIVDRLRAESRRSAGPEVFAAAEGDELELSARSAVVVAEPDFPAQAKPGSAQVQAGSGPGQNTVSPGSVPSGWPTMPSPTTACPNGAAPAKGAHASGQ